MSDAPVTLHPATETYLRNTPGLTYPQALTGRFPHIANRVVELKDDKDALREYLDALIEDRRGNRVGFAFEVLMDIQALRETLVGDVNGFQLDDTTKWVS